MRELSKIRNCKCHSANELLCTKKTHLFHLERRNSTRAHSFGHLLLSHSSRCEHHLKRTWVADTIYGKINHLRRTTSMTFIHKVETLDLRTSIRWCDFSIKVNIVLFRRQNQIGPNAFYTFLQMIKVEKKLLRKTLSFWFQYAYFWYNELI